MNSLQKTVIALAIGIAAAPALLLAQDTAPTQGGGPVVYQVEFREAVQPISGDFLIQSLEKANEANAAALLILVDTPGGLVSTTEEILDAFLASEVPILYYISPRGAMAASAGFIMALGADYIAAAPGTSLGAASVITSDGSGADDEGSNSTALKKMEEILGARARSMAERRGRDPELAASAIFEAKAWSAREAKDAGLVDMVVDSPEELLRQLHGHSLKRFDGTETILDLEGYSVVELEMSWRQQALNLLANPNVSYILLLIGVFGIMMELYNPGLIFPAVIGVVALVLFGFTVKILPITVIGVILVLMAIAFFIAEVKITSYGLLTLGGILCLVLGGLMLIGDEVPDVPELHVDPSFVIGFAALLGVITVWGMALVARAHSLKPTTGAEGLLGEEGNAATDLDPVGKVFLHGEYWDASASRAVPSGDPVRVTKVDGLHLVVEPVPNEPASGTPVTDGKQE